MNPTHELDCPPKDARRPRSDRLDRLALACAGRLYRDAQGGMWLVRGRPRPSDLFDGLRQWGHRNRLPAENAPAPVSLGFEVSQTTPVSTETIAQWRCQLARVRRMVGACVAGRRPWGARHAARLDEIETKLHWAEAQLGGRAISEYLLSPAEESALEERCSLDLKHRHLPPAWRWMVRLAVWLQGAEILTPLLESLRPHLLSPEDFAEVAALADFEDQIQEWKRNAKKTVEGRRRLPDLILAAIRSLPPVLAHSGSIEPMSPGRRPRIVCNELSARIVELLRGRSVRLSSSPIALLATLFGCGLTERKLGGLWFQRILAGKNGTPARAYVAALADESRRPGYRRMLATLETLEPPPAPRDLKKIRKVVQAGATREEMNWLAERHMPWDFNPATRPTRRLDRLMTARGMRLGYSLSATINLRADRELARAAGDWLARLPKATPAPAAQDAIARMMETLMIEAPLFHQCREAWLALLGDAPSVDTLAPGSLETWLARLRHYRRLDPERAALPGRIRRMLEVEAREARERTWLEERAAGDLSRERQARLTALTARKDLPAAERARKGAARKLLAWAQEAYATSAAEAISQVVAEKVGVWWRAVIGVPRRQLAAALQIAICNWSQKLRGTSRADLTQMLDSWNAHRGDYRRHLPGNADWLADARSRGIDVDLWLSPKPAEVVIAGQRLRIEVAHDPVEILLMGTWFRTCLSLDDFNHLAVLANAYDPDKAVLYVRDSQGMPVARKLVVLSSDDRLVGYKTYLRGPAWGDPALTYEEKGAKVDRALAWFAVHWARQAGLRGLANRGGPAIQDARFWHDDGEVSWPELFGPQALDSRPAILEPEMAQV